jgi:hypothetical protein
MSSWSEVTAPEREAGAVGAAPPLPSPDTRDQATSGVAGLLALYLVLQGDQRHFHTSKEYCI